MLKSICLSVAVLTVLVLAAGSARADSIDRRFGMTVQAGVLVPLTDHVIESTSQTHSALAYGGGFIYGLGRGFAGEVDVTHAPSVKVEQSGQKVGETTLTDIGLGLQYRFAPEQRVVPYLGLGVDVIKGEFTNTAGKNFGLSWTVGGHASAGIDFFITRGVALTVNAKGVYAAKGNMNTTALNYDPTSFAGTIGFRLFLPEHLPL